MYCMYFILSANYNIHSHRFPFQLLSFMFSETDLGGTINHKKKKNISDAQYSWVSIGSENGRNHLIHLSVAKWNPPWTRSRFLISSALIKGGCIKDGMKNCRERYTGVNIRHHLTDTLTKLGTWLTKKKYR